MAIVGNTASEVGDVMIIVTDIPLTGISSITGYTDLTAGETGTRFFDKKFRYSLDGGLNFNIGDYIDLNPTNLAAIPVDPTYDIVFEYRYERVGTDVTGLLEWNNTNLITVSVPYVSGDSFDSSIFSYFFATSYHPVLLGWCLNVLEKLYSPGILPQSMTRNENQNINQDDRDFIDFWRSVTHYYALLVGYARGFEEFRSNKLLLVEYLRQRGIYVCENQSLFDLQYVQEKYWDEMRHRGTAMIAKPKGIDVNGSPKPVDGELLRLICYDKDCDEFLFAISEFDSLGWVVNRWSPLWKGLSHQAQLTKIYESTMEVQDLTKYPQTNSSDISIVNDSDVGFNVMSISGVASGDKSGIGVVSGGWDEDFATNVDPSLAYELSFYVKSNEGSGPVRVSVSMFGYTTSGIPTPFQAMDDFTFPDQQSCLTEVDVVDGIWHKISVILHPHNSTYNAEPNYMLPNIGTGTNLRFKSDSTCKFIPKIYLDNSSGVSTSGEMRVYGMRLAPAYSDYSTGFINTANVIQTWIKNNQGQYTENQIENIMKTELIPYTATLQNNYL